MNHRLGLMLAAWMCLKIVTVRVLRYRVLVSDTFQADCARGPTGERSWLVLRAA
jgi:hypothetical protein